jgi:2-oxoglutarate dehydrogenase E2 component (dihydrolipoamide succinyltransferase)
MANFEIVLPKLGESIIEATITKWLKKPGDIIEEDDPIVEIATDKVDSEIPSPVEGRLIKIFFKEGDVVPVGKVIAIIDTEAGEVPETDTAGEVAPKSLPVSEQEAASPSPPAVIAQVNKNETAEIINSTPGRFYSPLVKSIAAKEQVTSSELDAISGTGKEGRVTKEDLLEYLKSRKAAPEPASVTVAPPVTTTLGDTIIEMDRMRKMIADHMVMSVKVSPHVTSYIEVDMTPIVQWRDKIKDIFLKRENQKITYTPIIVEATAQALREFPNVNASVDGYKIIQRKNINIGMAAALPNGNLIVPVIKNADQKNLLGLVNDVNSLADKARRNKLDPDDVMGGTFTITNFGTFNSLTGSPIINQPQVAILGVGVIKKRPVVLETVTGDVIAIRHIMILSLSYDHRVVDGALGGMFLKRLTELLENFNTSRVV